MNKKHFDKAINEARENLSGKSKTSFNEIKKIYGLGKYTAEDFKKALKEYGKPVDLSFEEIDSPYGKDTTDIMITSTRPKP